MEIIAFGLGFLYSVVVLCSFLDKQHYVECTNDLIVAGVLPKDYWDMINKRDDDELCRLKREAKIRGEHIVA